MNKRKRPQIVEKWFKNWKKKKPIYLLIDENWDFPFFFLKKRIFISRKRKLTRGKKDRKKAKKKKNHDFMDNALNANANANADNNNSNNNSHRHRS